MAMLLLPVTRRRNVKYRRIDPYTCFKDNTTFVRLKYQMTTTKLDRLTNMLTPYMEECVQDNWTISTRMKVLVGLRYLATNAHQHVIADSLGLSQKSVSNAISQFVTALNHHDVMERLIKGKFDQLLTCEEIARDFGKTGQMPNIIGALDGCNIRIKKPSTYGGDFYCRKGFTAINVLAACDAAGRFTYVDANFPGCWHDSAIYRGSQLKEAFDNGLVPRGFSMLGDSGFANSSQILTPFRNPTTVQQRRFNKTHRKMRVIIEQCFGVWKSRFRILQTEMRLEPSKAAQVVSACACLHNIFMSLRCGRRRRMGRRIARMGHPAANCRDIREYVTANIV